MSKYRELGVDVGKKGIESFRRAVFNLHPEAFCVVQPDPLMPGWGLVLHTDSAGSKTIAAYLGYRETGEPRWFEGLAQDALAMNINDLACVAAQPLSFVDYVAFNTLLIDRVDLLEALAKGFQDALDTLRGLGCTPMFAGGETADLPDLVRTLDVCVAMVGRVRLGGVVTGRGIQPGDQIIGVRSGGAAGFERGPNSGIMSNGHTLARTSLLSPKVAEEYPEVSASGPERYRGRYFFDTYVEELDATVGEALLSPTRLYAPLALEALERHGGAIHGLVHNTGGGLTKCLRLGQNIHYVKDRLPEPDPIFQVVQREGGVGWREMHQVFNMGVGFELVVAQEEAEDVLSTVEHFQVGAQIIGECKPTQNGNKLTIQTPHGRYTYP